MSERTIRGLTFELGRGGGGFVNPDRDKPCGALDATALLPEAQHLECKGCRMIIVDLLLSRQPAPPKPAPLEQTVFPFMDPPE